MRESLILAYAEQRGQRILQQYYRLHRDARLSPSEAQYHDQVWAVLEARLAASQPLDVAHVTMITEAATLLRDGVEPNRQSWDLLRRAA